MDAADPDPDMAPAEELCIASVDPEAVRLRELELVMG